MSNSNNIKHIPAQTWMLLGVILYSLNILVFIYYPFFFPTFFKLVGVIFFLFPLFTNKLRLPNIPARNIFMFFILWTLFVIFRGTLSGNFAPGKNTFLDSFRYAFLYPFAEIGFVIPFVVFLPLRIDCLYYFKRIGLICSIIGLISIGLKWNVLFSGNLLYGYTVLTDDLGNELSARNLVWAFLFAIYLILFLSFCYNYIKGPFKFLFVIYLFLFFLINVLGGGRGSSVIGLLYLILFFYLFYRYPLDYKTISVNKVWKNFITRLIKLGLIAGTVIGILYLYNHTSIFDYLYERIFDDGNFGNVRKDEGRDILFRDMINDFNFTPFDWITGRGANGSYSTVLNEISINGRRDIIEWGYMHFILKGGIPYLLMYIYLMLHAAYMGIFRSRNLLSIGMGLICATAIFCLFTQYIPSISVYYFIYWFCFAMVENKQIRQMKDTDIYGYFNYKNYIG